MTTPETGLSAEDTELVRRWVAEHGIDAVARIASALTSETGRRVTTNKPDVLLMLHLSHIMRATPMRNLNSAAEEISALYAKFRPHITQSSFATRLKRDFREYRQRLYRLAAARPDPTHPEIVADLTRQKDQAEWRAIGRLLTLSNDSVDIYDMLIHELRDDPERRRLVRAFGRERGCVALGKAIEREMAGGARRGPPPRTLYDLIKLELQTFDASCRSCGHKRP